MYVQRVKDILTEEFINLFLNEMDKIKLYNITSGTSTSNDISEYLLTIFEKGKMRRWNSRKELVKTHPISIFSIQSKEKKDTVERTTKIKIDGKVKDIVEQKNILG